MLDSNSSSTVTAPWATISFCILLISISVLIVNSHHVRLPDLQGDGDLSANGLLVRDARDLKLGVGPYSRLGYHHLGPVTFYYLAAVEPLIRVVPSPLGRQRIAILMLNLAGLAWALWLVGKATCRNSDIWLLAATLIFTILPIATTGYHPLLESWGPLTVIIPTLVFVLAAGPIAAGELKLLPVLCISGVFAAHNHLVNATLVAVLGLVVLASLVYLKAKHRLPQLAAREKRWLVFSLAFILLTSVPILVEQFSSDEGNISKILSFTMNQSHQPRQMIENVQATGWAAMVSVTLGVPGLKSMIGLVPPGLLLALIVIWCVAGWQQYRRATRNFKAMIIFVAMAYVLSFLIATQTKDNPVSVPYIFHFTSGFAGFFFFLVLKELRFWLKVLSARFYQFPERLNHWFFGFFLPALVIVIWIIRFPVAPMPGHPVPEEIWAALPLPSTETINAYLLYGGPEHALWPKLVSFVLQAEQRGYEVCVPRTWQSILGRRSGPGDPNYPMLLFSRNDIVTDSAVPELQQKVGIYSLFSPGRTFSEMNCHLVASSLEPLDLEQWIYPDSSGLGFRQWHGLEEAEGKVYLWNNGDDSSIFFRFSNDFFATEPMVLELILGAYERQTVSVLVNGKSVADFELQGFGAVHKRISIPVNTLQPIVGNEIRFLVPRASKPAGTDSRILAVRFIGLQFSAADSGMIKYPRTD